MAGVLFNIENQAVLRGRGVTTMKATMRKPPVKPSKVGDVVFLFEKMQAARELSSCCVGTEAMLETDSKRGKIGRHQRNHRDPENR